MKHLYYILYFMFFPALISCVTSENEKAFDSLNDKIENGNDEIKGQMEKSYGDFKKAIEGIESTGGSKTDIENIKQIQKQAIAIKELSKSLSNFFIIQSSELIKHTGDTSFGIKKEGELPINNHYYTDENGYLHLFPLNHLTQKDNYLAATELFIGENHNKLTGQFIIDSILAYRDNVCMIVSNYKDADGQKWSFTPPNIQYQLANDSSSLKEFQQGLESSLTTVNPLDTALVKQIYNILTPPNTVDNHGQVKPWLVNQFDHAPLVAAVAMFTAIRSDILQAENKAITHVASKVSSPKFEFNKIEPLAFKPEKILNQEDSTNKK